jgi:hypothetical protein
MRPCATRSSRSRPPRSVGWAALRAHEGEGRAQVLKAAADAVWCFLVQREVLGLRDRAAIVAQYDIPREVMVRLGAR